MLSVETKSLILKELNASEENSKFIYVLYNTKSFIQNIADKNLSNQEVTRDYIRSGPMAMYRNHGYGLWKVVLKNSGQAIGVCGLLKRDWLEYPDLGFALLPEFEGKGFAFEAAQATLDWADKNIADRRVLAITGKNNARSIALLNRLGFKFLTIVTDPESGQALQCLFFDLPAAKAMKITR